MASAHRARPSSTKPLLRHHPSGREASSPSPQGSARRTLITIPYLAAAIGISLTLSACRDSGTDVEPPPVPTVSAVSPNEGNAGTEVRIEGSGFQAGSAVFFDELQSPRVHLEGGALFALAPKEVELDSVYDIRVENSNQSLVEDDVLEAVFTAVKPGAIRVNGVTKPRGLEGMTIIIDGAAFGDSLALSEGQVFFEATNGSPLEATVTDETTDWADDFIVTSVPQGVADTSKVWVETLLGASDTVEFRLLQSGEFSPSNINWSQTTPLPEALQGLGAVFVPVEEGPSPANYVFVLGGADDSNTARPTVYRNVVEQTGALSGGWTQMGDMLEARAYHAATAATPFTAALDTATTSAVLYSVGGVDANDSTVSTVQLARVSPDGSVGTWETTTPLPARLHASGAAVFRGYMYVAGGANADDAAQVSVYRSKVDPDGSLGTWDQLDDLPSAMAHGSLVNFGPFLYAVGGETGTTSPVSATQSGGESNQVYLARLNLRTADLQDPGWSAANALGKTRSKHSAVFAGGALFVTSGIYSGTPGSSENTYAVLNSDGTLQPWQGATGSETIDAEIGISLYNQALLTFIDNSGTGHLLVLGGADIANEGTPSAAVVWY